MSLSQSQKQELNLLVDTLEQKMEDTANRVLDTREVEMKKNNFVYNGSNADTIKKEWNGIKDVFDRKSIEHSFELKTMTIGGQTGDVVGLQEGGLKNIQRNYLDISSFMPTINLGASQGELNYIVNSAESNNFDAIAENSDSSESSLSFTEKSAKPENIRSYFLASREMADDIGNFENFVTQRGFQMLVDQVNGQILNGNGTSPSLNGLTLSANRTSFDYTNANPYYQTVDGANEIDCLIVSINNLAISGYAPDVCLVNPAQFGKFSLLKSSQNEYLKNDNFRIINSFSAVLNGVQIYASNKVADDQFYMADSNKAFALVRKGGLQLRVTSEGQDLFKKNLVMMELQARIQNLILNPSATIYGDFSDAKTALETP
jgi:HK97 family phage major capsid protein